MKAAPSRSPLLFAAPTAFLFALSAVAGTTCRDGVAKAVPAPAGGMSIDGDLSDWNCSEPVLAWNAEETADVENCTLFFMYDEANFYIAYEMALPGGRMPENTNRPQDRYWRGDLVQVRFCTDKSVGWPLPNRKDPRLAKNPRVVCVNLWRDTAAGIDYCHIARGAMLGCPAATNPEGAAVRTKSAPGRFTLEARVPWTALGVTDGKCPFAPGGRMPAVVDIKWHPGLDGHYTAAVFAQDPGSFAFMNLGTWGQIEFSPPGAAETRSEKRRETRDEWRTRYAQIAAAVRGAAGPDTEDWAKIAFDLPKRSKVSVNVFDDKGGVVRELAGGEWRDAGRVEVRWDGRDALGFPCEAGRDYRWGVYAHDGLDVAYEGTVGTSGDPPYGTPDGKGGWGADHGPPVACATDDTGRYFAWHKSEQGAALVKTDFDGRGVWRANPFVRGGWGEYTAACAADGVLWLVHGAANGKAKAALVKIDAATGRHELFPDGRPFVELPADATATNLPAMSAARPEFGFNCAGIAAKGGAVYVSDRNGNRVMVVDAGTGEVVGEVAIASPRGLAFAPDGALWAVRGKSVARVVLCHKEHKEHKVFADFAAEKIDIGNLCAPYALAIGPDGTLYVSDLGESQQVKVYEGAASGRAALRNAAPTKVFGRRGGRGFLGVIDYDAFLMPFGLAVDKTGALLVAEASAPKVVTVLDAASGDVRRRYVGFTAYSPSNIPDCDDPLLQYYSISGPGSFARQRIDNNFPDAAWDFAGAGMSDVSNPLGTMQMPRIFRAPDGYKYLAPDTFAPSGDWRIASMLRIGGDGMVPAASVMMRTPPKKGAASPVRLWCDRNGDGARQDDEVAPLPARIAGRAFTFSAGRTPVPGVIFIDDDGTLFIIAAENAVIGVPCIGFSGGAPQWDAAAAFIAIPEIVPGLKKLLVTHRMGLRGIWRDSVGNFYGSLAYTPEYASPELQKFMSTGMGHTSRVGGVYICKWAPDGSPLWRVGRKATGSLKPGEMLGHWVHAGMVGDGYTAAASEWGVFTVYTSDGFFVDSLFDAPGVPGRGAPYAFSGEDFSGRIQAFPERGEVWAFNCGHAFRVTGFENGRVGGEWRTNGVVRLERVAPLHVPGAPPKPLRDARLVREGGRVVFTARVIDDTPLVNAATDATAVFKGGDAAGFEIGPGKKIVHNLQLANVHKSQLPSNSNCPQIENIPAGERNQISDLNNSAVPSVPSGERKVAFTRILAARIGGKDRVIALQQGGTRLSRPQEYTTPAGGTASFSFVGDVPGATVAFAVDGDGKGYSVRVEVPEEFLELDFSKPVFWDAEALFSGDGARGTCTMKRVYLHNRETSHTSMVDDTPTEARLHPEGYEEVRL